LFKDNSEKGPVDYLEFIARVNILIVGFVVLGVSFLLSDIRRWKLRKMSGMGGQSKKEILILSKRYQEGATKTEGL